MELTGFAARLDIRKNEESKMIPIFWTSKLVNGGPIY